MTRKMMDLEITELSQLQLATDTGQLSLDCPVQFPDEHHFGDGNKMVNVLRDIDRLECSPEFRALNFQESFCMVEVPNGGFRQQRMFELTRDGFVFLAMGFTGPDARSLGKRCRRSAAVRRSTLRRNRRFMGWLRGCDDAILASLPAAF